MAQLQQEYTGTWIPAVIMLNDKLKPMEKMLYAEIASFRQCFASNKWLAERLGISERTVQTGVSKLKEMQLITVFENPGKSRICIAATQNLHPPTQNLRDTHAKSAPKNKDSNTIQKNTELDAQLNELATALNRRAPNHPQLYRAKLLTRLKRYRMDDLKSAAAAIMQNEFMVKNGHNTLEYITRNDMNIEKWLTSEAKKPAYL